MRAALWLIFDAARLKTAVADSGSEDFPSVARDQTLARSAEFARPEDSSDFIESRGKQACR